MNLQFEATIDDLVDVTIRSYAHSKTLRKRRWQGGFTSGAIFALIWYVVFPKSTGVRLAIAAAGFIIGFAFHLATYQKSLNKRVRKLCREQLGTDNTLTVTGELSESGISLAQMGVRISYDWSVIERLEEAEDAIYFYRTDGGCFAVRKRAFESDASRDEFLRLAEANIERS